jgi:serine/threonine-protein kinase HipA
MSDDQLAVLLAGRAIGKLTRGTGRKLRFEYDQGWRSADGGYPLSLAMPLAAARYDHKSVSAYLWGLLPENSLVLDHWARQFQVSAADPFGLLEAVGEDCPGAVQFVRPERAPALLAPGKPDVAWLSEADIAERIRQLREDHGAWRSQGDAGQFSLAGAQPKTALLFDGRRYGVPAGRTPTTHILKPPLPELDGHAENEHLCLGLARALGLPTAGSSVQHFGDEVAIVIERYDRVRRGAQWRRIHQEDICQALGVMPSSKYQSEGGPSAKQVFELLRTYSSRPHEDIQTFSDALIFNWLIAGTDAHAKNYSILIGSSNQVRLAPLYDLASAYAYRRFDPHKLKLAMKIGSSYRIREIDHRRWQTLAREARLDETALISRAKHMAAAIPDEFAALRKRSAREGLKHPAIDRLQVALQRESARCTSRLDSR